MLYLLAFVLGSLTTIALDRLIVALKRQRGRRRAALKSRIIAEHERIQRSWTTIEAQGHGPWCAPGCKAHV